MVVTTEACDSWEDRLVFAEDHMAFLGDQLRQPGVSSSAETTDEIRDELLLAKEMADIFQKENKQKPAPDDQRSSLLDGCLTPVRSGVDLWHDRQYQCWRDQGFGRSVVIPCTPLDATDGCIQILHEGCRGLPSSSTMSTVGRLSSLSTYTCTTRDSSWPPCESISHDDTLCAHKPKGNSAEAHFLFSDCLRPAQASVWRLEDR